MHPTLLLLLLFTAQLVAVAAQQQPPPLIALKQFTSANKKLDLVMVAKPTPASLNFPQAPPTAQMWQYHTCLKKSPQQMDCGNQPVAAQGVMLKLQPGDQLKIRLVNQLLDWRTNLHFHGLVVSTDYDLAPANNGSTAWFADYPFVIAYNSRAELTPPAAVSLPLILRKDFIDYKLTIPNGHPKGLYWFHPHNHEMRHGEMNEGNEEMINAGLSGAMVIGNLPSYVSNIASAPQHVLLLRTTFFNAKWNQISGPSPLFCSNEAAPLPGYCNGTGSNANSTAYYTVNGQVFPRIQVPRQKGAVLRLVQSMASMSLKLTLVDDATNKTIPVFVLAADGASTLPQKGSFIDEFLFMPGSRVDLFVPASTNNKPRTATLMGWGPSIGWPTKLNYPNVKLAQLAFPPARAAGKKPVPLPVIKNNGGKVKDAMEKPPRTDVSCVGLSKALPAGHRRRILFGAMSASSGALTANTGAEFGLGYAELDSEGKVVPGTEIPVTMFDPEKVTVCAKLGTTEVWEIVNLTVEDHNFHIHQTKFKVLSMTRQAGGGVNSDKYVFTGKNVDSTPLAAISTTVVSISHVRSGDYALHCHITYHSDHGMMARIRVAEEMD